MSYLTKNRIDVSVTEDQINQVKEAFKTIKTALPFLIGLSAQERQQLPKINVSNKVFTADTIKVAQESSEILPKMLNTEGIAKDLKLFEDLDALLVQSRQITELLEDTAMLAGSEAYVGALTLYRFFGAAATSGMPGADAVYNKLRKRFTQTKAKDQTVETEESTSAED